GDRSLPREPQHERAVLGRELDVRERRSVPPGIRREIGLPVERRGRRARRKSQPLRQQPFRDLADEPRAVRPVREDDGRGSPAGSPALLSRNRARTRTARPSRTVWPAARRSYRTSAGSNAERPIPSGAKSSSRTASRYERPLTTSMTRPAATSETLLYENTPSGATCSSVAIAATPFAIASSPKPVGVRYSPNHPAVCVKRSRTVTAGPTAPSATRTP